MRHRSAWARIPSRGPTIRGWIPSCWPPVTAATSWTAIATGATRPSWKTWTQRRHPFHVAVENWQHDFNIGSVVRNANAFGAQRRAHRRPAPLEPPWRDGDRPLPARRSTIPTSPGRSLRWADRPRTFRSSESTICPARGNSRFTRCPNAACCCSARRARACQRRPSRRARSCAGSASSARPARSTPGLPAPSPCGLGCAGTPGADSYRPNVLRTGTVVMAIADGSGPSAARGGEQGGERSVPRRRLQHGQRESGSRKVSSHRNGRSAAGDTTRASTPGSEEPCGTEESRAAPRALPQRAGRDEGPLPCRHRQTPQP